MIKQIITLLVCPITKQNLLPLKEKHNKILLKALDQGYLRHLDGCIVAAQTDKVKFIITENGQHIYIVLNGLAIMVESKQIVFPEQN